MAKGYTAAVKAYLLEHGRLDVATALFEGIDGLHPTRIAAIIHPLRHKDGWVIDTEREPGKLAVYVLRYAPGWAGNTVPAPAPDPEDDMPGFHGMPPEEPDPRTEEVLRAGRAAEARTAALTAPDCPKPNCPHTLGRVRQSFAPGWVTGWCPTHREQNARKKDAPLRTY